MPLRDTMLDVYGFPDMLGPILVLDWQSCGELFMTEWVTTLLHLNAPCAHLRRHLDDNAE